MAKKKAKVEAEVETTDAVPAVDPFVGGEDDDLMDMQYIQDETTHDRLETHPPETEEEAELLAEQEKADGKTEESTAERSEEGEADESSSESSKGTEGSSDEKSEAEANEGDETKVAKTEPEVEPEVDDDGIKIPKHRYDEVNDRMKKAEKDRDDLKAQLENVTEEAKVEPEPEPYDYKTKEAEAMEAMLEGDSEKYSAINAEIRGAEKAELIREAKKVSQQGDQQLQDALTFEEAGSKIEGEFPEFSPGNEVFNADAHEELLDLYVGYAQSGKYSRVQALQRAAKQTARNFDIQSHIEAGNTAPDETPDNVVDIKPVDVKAKAKVDNAQPPAMESRAEGESEEPRRDFSKMSDEEFDALPESTKRRARGDIFNG